MFNGATSFNGDLSQWDVSAVTIMSHMFWKAESFNGDISRWDVNAVTDMWFMFQGAKMFTGVFHNKYYVCGNNTTKNHYESVTKYTTYFTRIMHIKQNSVLVTHCCTNYPYTICSEFIRHNIGNDMVKILNPRYKI